MDKQSVQCAFYDSSGIGRVASIVKFMTRSGHGKKLPAQIMFVMLDKAFSFVTARLDQMQYC